MVHACQKGEKCASKKVKDMAKKISDKDVEEFAKTKRSDLPQKKHETFEEYMVKQDALNEVGTTTAAVATFKQPIFDEPVRRKYPKKLNA